MSGLNLELFYDGRRSKWRILCGSETFYNEKNEMREWDTREELLEWLSTDWVKMTPYADKYKIIERGHLRIC